MSIGVSVRTTKFAARNNGIGVRQERSPQSAPNHIRGTLCVSLKNKKSNHERTKNYNRYLDYYLFAD